MGAEAIIVSIILLLAVVLFISERFSVDVVALGVMILLVIAGIITPGEGLAGFSNPATITVAGMFVLSAALFKTGAIDLIGVPLANIFRKNYKLGLLSMMLTVGIISAFINNTPVVAIFWSVALPKTTAWSLSAFFSWLRWVSSFLLSASPT